jgi:hypothetical protein
MTEAISNGQIGQPAASMIFHMSFTFVVEKTALL